MFRYKLLIGIYSLAYRWSSKRQIGGVRVSFLLPDEADWRVLEPKMSAALELIAQHAPVRFRNLVSDVGGIWVLGEVGPIGVWDYRLGAIRLRRTYCLDPQVSAAHLACTIVHEATHAFLWRLGFRYPERHRVQIERICMRSERVFLQQVPGEEALLERMRGLPDPAEERYSSEAFRKSALDQLQELETPAWAMYLLGARPQSGADEPARRPNAPHP